MNAHSLHFALGWTKVEVESEKEATMLKDNG